MTITQEGLSTYFWVNDTHMGSVHCCSDGWFGWIGAECQFFHTESEALAWVMATLDEYLGAGLDTCGLPLSR